MTEQINDATTGSSFTANPRAPKDNTRYEEKPGEITSDSLAAESINSGGSFASGHAAAGKVASGSSTASTSDASAATVLPPAKDAASRDDRDVSLGGSSGGGSGSTGSSSGSTGGNSGVSTSQASDSSAQGAASYSSAAQTTNENAKPKGENITEGGFDSSAPNASFNNDIGGKNDPGRVAEQKMLNDAAKYGADAGYGGASQAKDTTQGVGYEALNSNESA